MQPTCPGPDPLFGGGGLRLLFSLAGQPLLALNLLEE